MVNTLLVKWKGRHFVLTNSHVVEHFNPEAGEYIQLLTKGKSHRFADGYVRWVGRRESEIQGVWSEFNHQDAAALELTDGDIKFALKSGFKFHDLPDEPLPPPAAGQPALFLARPQSGLERGSNERLQFQALDPFAGDISVCDHGLLLLSCNHKTPSGTLIPLQGSSGAGVYGLDGTLYGIVWGGWYVRREVYATSTSGIYAALTGFFGG